MTLDNENCNTLLKRSKQFDLFKRNFLTAILLHKGVRELDVAVIILFFKSSLTCIHILKIGQAPTLFLRNEKQER